MLLESYSISVSLRLLLFQADMVYARLFFVRNLHDMMIDREFREWNPKNARSMEADVVVTSSIWRCNWAM